MGTSLQRLRPTTAVLALGLLATSCGSGSSASGNGPDRANVVVTTNILGDVVRNAVGDLVDVEVIMPIGSDPHVFAPSARQAEAMEDADLLVMNGAGFEDAMRDIILNVEDSGTPTFAAADHVSLRTLSPDDHDDGLDPHFWTDPDRVVQVVEALGSALDEMGTIDSEQLSESVSAYVDELTSLAERMDETLANVPAERRVLVTNHEVFGYFADRFDFEVVGTVIPSLSTGAESSAAALERLADVIEAQDVPAVFAETTTSSRLAEVLADAVEGDRAGQVVVVELFSESLGDPGSGAETYTDMMATNATLVAAALGGG